jgi:hypothetical protein
MTRRQIEIKYPKVDIKNDEFVQRDEQWLKEYKKDIEESVPDQGYPPWTYAWFRCLDDGKSDWYGPACRVLDICPKCFKEWNQMYYATHCQCFADSMRVAVGEKINTWAR